MTTKLDSYETLIATKADRTQRARILAMLRRRPMTRAQLEDHFREAPPSIRLASICGRVAELMEDGQVIVKGTAWDERTQRRVELLVGLPPKVTQKKLF